jgi:hypothetical protein
VTDDDDNKICRENQNTPFMFDKLFFPENRAICEIMWKNIVQPDRPQITIWLMIIACWIPKGKNTHLEYAVLIPFPLQKLLHERASVFVIFTLPVLFLCQ